jgi:hypothetical protein
MSEENFRINGTEENQGISKQDLKIGIKKDFQKTKKKEKSVLIKIIL